MEQGAAKVRVDGVLEIDGFLYRMQMLPGVVEPDTEGLLSCHLPIGMCGRCAVSPVPECSLYLLSREGHQDVCFDQSGKSRLQKKGN